MFPCGSNKLYLLLSFGEQYGMFFACISAPNLLLFSGGSQQANLFFYEKGK